MGILGNLVKYAVAFDVFQAVSGSTFQLSTLPGSENNTSSTNILLTATSVGANLNATGGSADIYLLVSNTGF